METEGNSGSDGKSEWSEMVQACVEEGWWACSEKSIGVWSEGQEEMRMTKEDAEDASGEGGCLELINTWKQLSPK